MPENTPQWIQPYLAAAMRSGLIANLPDMESGSFDMDAPITGAEAAVMLQNALDLALDQESLATFSQLEEDIPAWAASSLTVLQDNGITMQATDNLTRADAAKVLYKASILAINAPGTAVFRLQQ